MHSFNLLKYVFIIFFINLHNMLFSFCRKDHEAKLLGIGGAKANLEVFKCFNNYLSI